MSKIADDPRKVKRKTAAVSELVGALSDIAPVLELFKQPVRAGLQPAVCLQADTCSEA